MTDTPLLRVVVAAVITGADRVLAGERSGPATLAGRWEFPGGTVESGETEAEALVRECQEELGIVVHVGTRVGMDVAIQPGASVLRAYAVTTCPANEPQPLQHRQLRWLAPHEMDGVPWLPADAVLVPAVVAALRDRRARDPRYSPRAQATPRNHPATDPSR